MRRIIRIANITAIIVTSLLYIASLVLSYATIAHTAAAVLPTWSAWTLPAVVDGALIVFSVIILRNSLMRESTRNAWIAAIVAVVVSIILNILEGIETRDVLSVFIHSIPPIAAAVTFKFLIVLAESMVARESHRDYVIGRMKVLAAHARRWRKYAKALSAENAILQSVIDDFQVPVFSAENFQVLEIRNERLETDAARLETDIAQLKIQLQNAHVKAERLSMVDEENTRYAKALEKARSELSEKDAELAKNEKALANVSPRGRQFLTQVLADELSASAFAKMHNLSASYTSGAKKVLNGVAK